MARKNSGDQPVPVAPELIDQAFAKAVADGDIVNLRFLFAPFSPARQDSPEQFRTDKYAYLLPDGAQENDARYSDALAIVRNADTQAHIYKELEAKRPAQLPSELLLALADNAVAAGKFTSAAQAYEALRIRQRMQETFFEQAEAALDAGDMARAVRGYRIGIGLAYDYAAFPEPLPDVPDYQTRILVLHADYPENPEDCVAMQAPETHMRTALGFLLRDAETAARLDRRSIDVRAAFIVALVRQIDPAWDAFAQRYREAVVMAREFGSRLGAAQAGAGDRTLEQEIENVLGKDPREITAHLLGRVIEQGEWWQYLKDLAYRHPAAGLFVARLAVGDHEFLIPRYRADSPVVRALGLAVE
ncbi:MAG TPA: hypothetical protein PLO37_06325 [Candidatus Hydrogenedentes bacterium]|nr:hypothetical protein [Candidatus Hydrogenedentota bacterium]HPG66446.1 hypothetical protein [Candidatus Hydrogenedentota bacterium]